MNTQINLTTDMTDEEIEGLIRAEFPEAPADVLDDIDELIETAQSIAFRLRRGDRDLRSPVDIPDEFLDTTVTVRRFD